MKKALNFFAFAGLFAVMAFGRSQKESKSHDEQALRKI